MKILIIRFSSIGDIVLTTPIVRCLKQQLNAEIHYLTKQSFATLLEFNPHIDQIFTIQKKVAEVLPELKNQEYDYIIDLHKNIRSWQVKKALTAQSFSFNKINFEKWLMVNFKINRLPNKHIVDRYFETVHELGVENDGGGLEYFLPTQPPNPLEGMGELSQGEKGKVGQPEGNEVVGFRSYIAFAIGAAHATKRLPKEKIISICQKTENTIVLLGGKDVAEEGEVIATEAGKHVLNLCGKVNLHESAFIIKEAEKVITHDTGMMHIAAAFQKEIISIWGNTIPGFGMYPYYKSGIERNHTIEIKKLSCRPCSKIGYKKCPKGHFKCMMLISEEEINQYYN